VEPQNYVLGAWLPTLLAVVLSIPWHLLTSAIKEIEPIYQSCSPDGVLAEDSIALNYKASSDVVAIAIAMKKRHYVVWWSGLGSLITLVISPLASETVFLRLTGTCTATSGRSACFPELVVSPAPARTLQLLLIFLTVLTFVLAITIFRRRNDVYSDPLSIAGLAALFQQKCLTESFRRMKPYNSSLKDIQIALEGNYYIIGKYGMADGADSYGLTIVHENVFPVECEHRTSSLDGKKYTSVAVDCVEGHPFSAKRKACSSKWLKSVLLVLFALFVLGLEVLVIYYNRVGGDTGFERFMDSNTFGVSFLFTAVGVSIKLCWTLLDEGKQAQDSMVLLSGSHFHLDLRTTEAYRQLSRGKAKATDSILLNPNSNPFTGFFHSLTHRHLFNSYVSCVAILCELLIVAVANIPFRPGSVYIAYKVSTWITVAVLSMMLTGIVWMLCSEKTPGMIKRPDTIASVLLMLCGSHMLGDFSGMAMMSRSERDIVIRGWDKRYAMGSLVGVDGVERESVDESKFIKTPLK